MKELIKVKNEGYAEYEELLLYKDQIKKDTLNYQVEYIREFGEWMTSIFRKKVNCIQKKKMIRYYQMAINKGETIDENEMQHLIQQEMKEYYQQLEQMIEDNKAIQDAKPISLEELTRIKRLYRKLAKLIHPDVNPKTEQMQELKQLWNMVVMAYHSNNLKELQEAEVLIQRVLKDESIEIKIENLKEKIQQVQEEIYKIKETIPYQYKYLLEDKESVKEKKIALQDELKKYEDYEKELDDILKKIKEVEPWQMN